MELKEIFHNLYFFSHLLLYMPIHETIRGINNCVISIKCGVDRTIKIQMNKLILLNIIKRKCSNLFKAKRKIFKHFFNNRKMQ